MKQVEQIGKVLSAILADLLNLKKNLESDHFEIVKKELSEILTVDIEKLVILNENEFVENVSKNLHGNRALFEELSNVLSMLGDLCVENKMFYYSKSLLCLQEIITITQTFSIHIQSKIINLQEKLENCTIK